jgi:hypothetical protein
MVALGVSFSSPVGSFAIYGLFAGIIIVSALLGKGELVVVWPGTHEEGEQIAPKGSNDN